MRNWEFFIESKEECICRECKAKLKHRDVVPRIQRYPDKEPQWFIIERRQCTNESCRRIHRILPDEMIEFKHYSAETIEDVEDGVISEEDGCDHPSDNTMRHWRWWFEFNKDHIESQLRSAVYRFLDQGYGLLKSMDSLLDEIRNRISPGWLGTSCRIINNSGGYIMTHPEGA